MDANGTQIVDTSGTPGDVIVTESSVFVPSEYVVSTQVQRTFEIAVDLCLSLIVSVVGAISNVLIIVVFSKQGFKDTINISMTFIAVWDLAKCLAGAMQRMAGPIRLVSSAQAASWSNVSVVAFSYLICFSSYVSSGLAAFVALERCLCVSMPFKVKDIITPKVTFIACFSISVVIFSCFAVMWSIYDIVEVDHPVFNQSIYVYQYNDFYRRHGVPLFEYYNLSGVIWPILSFVIISSCTVIIVYYLRKSSSFRSGGTLQAQSEKADSTKLSPRDRQIVKMLLVIIVIYIVNLSPRIINYMSGFFIPEFYFLRLYHNLFMVVSYWIFFFDLLNAAVNLYIFLLMSTSFRGTFFSLFPFCAREADKKGYGED